MMIETFSSKIKKPTDEDINLFFDVCGLFSHYNEINLDLDSFKKELLEASEFIKFFLYSMTIGYYGLLLKEFEREEKSIDFIDSDVLDYIKSQAATSFYRGSYQTLINKILREYMYHGKKYENR